MKMGGGSRKKKVDKTTVNLWLAQGSKQSYGKRKRRVVIIYLRGSHELFVVKVVKNV